MVNRRNLRRRFYHFVVLHLHVTENEKRTIFCVETFVKPSFSNADMPSSSRRRSEQAESLLDWQLDEIREAFNIFDADATGKVSYSELRAAMRALNYNPKRSELRSLVEEVDPSLTGFVDFEGFLAIMSKHARAVDVRSEVDAIFALFAGDRKTISEANLREAAKEIGENMSDDDIRAMVQALSNDSGAMSQEAFARIMMPRQIGDDLDLVDD